MLPIVTATGVASPNAQGQEITRTQTALTRENSTLRPKAIQRQNVATATKNTKGTKRALTLSAMRSIGALDSETASTRARILEKRVSEPASVTRMRNHPEVTFVAQETSSRVFFKRGRLSPVRIDSSTSASPERIFPSAGTASPARTTRVSPTRISEASILSSTPLRRRTAFCGRLCARPSSAATDLSFALPSSHLPIPTKA